MPDWSIDHISAVTLAVHDMAESVTFYERLGGCPKKSQFIS
jgi:catechol 2,3-dioxygenase-like lactoylglutathione lyase family enzyme